LETAKVTLLLKRVREGDRLALEELLPLIYAELKRLAQGELRRDRTGHTLQPTALIHEAYLRIFGTELPAFRDRGHFLGIMARVMRQVLIDYSRVRRAQKRGNGLQVPFVDTLAVAGSKQCDILLVNEALTKLEQYNPRLGTLIEMRFFAGMTAEDTAEALGESVHAVRHELRYAQAWLRRALDAPSGAN